MTHFNNKSSANRRLKNLIALGVLIFGTLLFLNANFSYAQEDPKAILQKCFSRCMDLQGGNFTMEISKKSYAEGSPVSSTSECNFLRVEGDSASPFKFFARLNSGDGTLCTSNDLVRLNAGDSTGVIYSRSSNQSMFRGAFQSDGLFPPFFQPQVVFSLDRLDQTTFIVRKGKDEEAMGKACFSIKLIDLIRAALPDGQRQEKTFLIDKKTFLPVLYSEKSVMKLNNDTVVKENIFRLTALSVQSPHDSLFIFKSIPSWFKLRNILGSVYHHHLKPGMEAPGFRGKIMGGDSTDLGAFKGKKVVLFFFHLTSYPSLKALNGMQEFQNAHPAHQVLLIGIDAGEQELKTLLSKRNISLKAIEDGAPIADSYFITSAPTFVLIDEKGIIQKIKSGYGEGAEAELK